MAEASNDKNLGGAIESILFVYGEPMSIARITKILKKGEDFKKVTQEEVKDALTNLTDVLTKEQRGVALIFAKGEDGEEVQLATRPEFSPLVQDFIKEEFKENLTPASLETLAIIAYLGPLHRAQIDYYRGVNSSFIVRSLLIRGLIDRYPDPAKSNIYLYRPSFDLLKYLGIQNIEQLPEFEKFKDIAGNNNHNHSDAAYAGMPEEKPLS